MHQHRAQITIILGLRAAEDVSIPLVLVSILYFPWWSVCEGQELAPALFLVENVSLFWFFWET